jgi:hypothetical protein
MVCSFAVENNMTVMSTQFQHEAVHKGTWISPDLTTVNQIENILIKTNKKEIVQDVPNCDSDHLPVKSTIKQQLITMPRRSVENRKKWNLDSIRNPAKLKQYRQTIYEKLLQKMEQTNVNHEWENKKQYIRVGQRNYKKMRQA